MSDPFADQEVGPLDPDAVRVPEEGAAVLRPRRFEGAVLRPRRLDEDLTDYARDVLVPFLIGDPLQGGGQEMGVGLGALGSVLARHLLPRSLRTTSVRTARQHTPTRIPPERAAQQRAFSVGGGVPRELPIEATRVRRPGDSLKAITGQPPGQVTTFSGREAVTRVGRDFADRTRRDLGGVGKPIAATAAMAALSFAVANGISLGGSIPGIEGVAGEEGWDVDLIRQGDIRAQRGDYEEAMSLYFDAGLDDQQVHMYLSTALNEELSNPDAVAAERTRRHLEGRYRADARVNRIIENISMDAGMDERQQGVSPLGTPEAVAQGEFADLEHDAAMHRGRQTLENRLEGDVVVDDFIEHEIPAGAPTRVSRPGETREGSAFRQFVEPDFMDIHQVAGGIFDMDPEPLIDLQHKLFATGFYGNSSYEDIRFGIADLDTMGAFRRFLENAAMMTAHNERTNKQHRTWRSLLDSWVSEMGGLDEALAERMSDEQPTFVATLSDPEGIRQGLTDIARNVIGREALSREEQQTFVAMMHNEQREAQLQHQMAQAGMLEEGQARDIAGGQAQAIDVIQPDVGARGEQFIRERHPDEATAQAIRGQIAAFEQLIGGA